MEPISIFNDSDFVKKFANFLWVNCKDPLSAKLVLEMFQEEFGMSKTIISEKWEEFCRQVFNDDREIIDVSLMCDMFEFVFPNSARI